MILHFLADGIRQMAMASDDDPQPLDEQPPPLLGALLDNR